MRAQTCARALLLLCLLPAAIYAQDQAIAPSQAPASAPAPAPAAPSTPPDKIRVGGNVMMAKLVSQTMPVYPQIAKQAHISGTVVLHAILGKDGSVQDLQYISGPPLLMKAAMDAVRQWRYEPVLLNGEAVTVDTTVSVVFQLGDSGPKDSSVSGSQSATHSPAPHPQVTQSFKLMSVICWR